MFFFLLLELCGSIGLVGWFCANPIVCYPHAGYVQGRFLREMTGGHVVVDIKVLLYMFRVFFLLAR